MGIVQTITEGGQVWAHRFRMLRQVFKIATTFSLLLCVLLFAYNMTSLPAIVYQASWYNLKAQMLIGIADKIEIDQDVWAQIARERHSSGNPIVRTERVLHYTNPYAEMLLSQGKDNVEKAGMLSSYLLLVIISFFFIRGSISKRKKHISGKKIYSARRIALKLRLNRKASDIKIGSLPLVKDTETQHILITGGTGSGKTNCFNHILPHIREKGQRAVVVDTTGIFVERYFRPGKDILLNPFEGNASWHPWSEGEDRIDYEAIAENFIPQSHSEHENYWRVAARSLFSSILLKVSPSKKTSELSRWLLFEPLSKICNFVQGTKAAAHLDMNSEKTSGSVRSVASSFLECLEFLQDTETPFSIRNWVKTETDDSWLFLVCKPAQRAALNPLLTCWFSVATRSLLQMKPDFKRRLWFVIDELPTLHRLKDLESFLSESRKYGGCALIALQSPAQLEAIYGPRGAQTIIGNCATKIVFSEQDPEVAEKISKAFGEREIKEYQEGLSYGANDVRDGVNLSLQTRVLPIVSSTMIQSLERNEAFVKLPGNLPVARIKLSIAT